MKTILVDAWNTFVTPQGIDVSVYKLLESYPNKKIIVTNADDEQMITFGLVNLPYEIFTLKHNPDKVDPNYFIKFFENYNLTKEDVIYFEHNSEAVKSAQSVGINAYHFDKDIRNPDGLKSFLDSSL
jgi:FMN phosphatase YigB (HAD superfamily)